MEGLEGLGTSDGRRMGDTRVRVGVGVLEVAQMLRNREISLAKLDMEHILLVNSLVCIVDTFLEEENLSRNHFVTQHG